jgi:hypothetical protein
VSTTGHYSTHIHLANGHDTVIADRVIAVHNRRALLDKRVNTLADGLHRLASEGRGEPDYQTMVVSTLIRLVRGAHHLRLKLVPGTRPTVKESCLVTESVLVVAVASATALLQS